MEQLTACPVCLANDFKPIMKLRDHMVSGEDFNLVECGSCTLRLLNPRPGPEAIAPYYNSDEYISHSGTTTGLINRLYSLAQKFTMRSKRNLVLKAAGKKRGQLLDIGCGRGLFLHTMLAADWQVSGLEPNAAAREMCNRDYGLDVLPMEELANIPSQSQDIITMWHVLEHVHDLPQVLGELKRILTDSGKLILALPNYTSFDAIYYEEYWAAYDPPRHLYHFSPVAVEHLCQVSGLSLLSSARMPLDSFYVALLSEKYKAGNGNMVRGMWIGMRSLLGALARRGRSSSVIYRIGNRVV